VALYGGGIVMQGRTETDTAATVVVPSALAGFAGGRSHILVELAEDTAGGPRSPLTAVLDQLRVEVPALERRIRDERGRVRGHVNIYVDGTDIRELGGVETVIVPGATVHIIAAVSGG
jgi:molybdopterin converting factor small subunit